MFNFCRPVIIIIIIIIINIIYYLHSTNHKLFLSHLVSAYMTCMLCRVTVDDSGDCCCVPVILTECYKCPLFAVSNCCYFVVDAIAIDSIKNATIINELFLQLYHVHWQIDPCVRNVFYLFFSIGFHSPLPFKYFICSSF